jgi:Protein of unknown function (DUF1344)
MKKLIAAAAVLPLFASVALAVNQTDTGTIKRLNAAKGTIELSDGKMFSVPKSIKLSALKANEKVTVTYTLANGKMHATRVVAAK